MENEYLSAKEFLEQAGGIDGFMRETELSGPLEETCERLRQFFVERESTGTFSLEDYNTGKKIILELSTKGEVLVRMVRKLDGSRSDAKQAALLPA